MRKTILIGRVYTDNIAAISHTGSGEDRDAVLMDFSDLRTGEQTHGLEIRRI